MLGVELGNFEFLLTCEVHHEDIKGIGARYLAVLDLRSDDLDKVPEVLIVILPVAAIELGVHKGHQGVRLVDIQGKCLLVVLQSLVEFSLKFEHVSEAGDCTGAFGVDLYSFGVLDKGFFDLRVGLEEVTSEFVRSFVIRVHREDLVADLQAVILPPHFALKQGK